MGSIDSYWGSHKPWAKWHFYQWTVRWRDPSGGLVTACGLTHLPSSHDLILTAPIDKAHYCKRCTQYLTR